MPPALLPGKELNHGVVWITAVGCIDARLGATLALAARNSISRHDNRKLLLDFCRASFSDGQQSARRLAASFSPLIEMAVTINVAMLTSTRPAGVQYLEHALRLRSHRVAQFSRWQPAVAWLEESARSDASATTPVIDLWRSLVQSRLGIPRTRLEHELIDLYLCLQQLADRRGIHALRDAARVPPGTRSSRRGPPPALRGVRRTRRRPQP